MNTIQSEKERVFIINNYASILPQLKENEKSYRIKVSKHHNKSIKHTRKYKQKKTK